MNFESGLGENALRFKKLGYQMVGFDISEKNTSFELHITEDERKLTPADLRHIQGIFPKAEVRRSFIFARFDKFYREGSRPGSSMLQKLNYYLLSYFPFLGSLDGTVVMILKK